MFEQYRSSGRIGPLGIPAMLLVGGVGAVVLGVIYAYVIAWIPFIYISCIASIGLGAILGLGVDMAARFGRVRNPAAAHFIGFIAGLVGLYVAWAWDGTARFSGEADMPVFWNPIALWGYVNLFYHEGFWTLVGDNAVSGIFLGIVWAIEAVVIVGASTFLAGSNASEPFCESCGVWTDETEDFKRLLPPEDKDALEQLGEGNLDVLSAFTSCSPGKPQTIRLDLHACPECADTRFLTVNLARISMDDEGEVSDETTPIVERLILDAEKMQWLQRTLDGLPVDDSSSAEDEEIEEDAVDDELE